MRKTLLITLFVATTILATGQDYTVAYFSISPEDLGVGMRIDRPNTYMSMTYGNYSLPYGGYIHDHARVSIGGLYKWFSLGLSYHHYGEVYTEQQLTNMALKPVSVEMGARIFIGRFSSCIRYDILKHEGILDFGWTIDLAPER